MKKLLAILLALAMVMSLAACGSDSKDDDDKKDKDEVVEEVETEEEDDKKDKDDKEDKDDKNDKNDKDDKNDKNDKEDKGDKNDKPGKGDKAESASDLTHGTISGKSYANDSINLAFELPSTSWQFLSDKEVAAMMNVSDSFEGDPEEYLDQYGLFYDMCTMSSNTGDSVIVMVQDIASLGIDFGGYDDVEDIYLAGITSQTESSGMFTDVSEYEDVTLSGETYRRVVCGVSASGVTGEQAYYVCAGDDYVVCIIITSFATDLSEIEACFG